MIKVGIIGGAGYTAGELLRILLFHPQVKIQFVCSESQQGKPIVSIHHDLLGETGLKFTGTMDGPVDILFVCSGHGKSKEILQKHNIDSQTRVIDLSNDFRLKANALQGDRHFVYGIA